MIDDAVPGACPFCQTDSTKTDELELDLGRWAVVCSSCGAIGPLTSSKVGAVWRWNASGHRKAISDTAPEQK
jgi:transcription initiation factor TFIIIB Brf1 subunit/transcription initiation factor TFIIB